MYGKRNSGLIRRIGTACFFLLMGVDDVGADDWPMARHDAAGAAAVRLATTIPSTPRAWTFEAGGRVNSYEPGLTVWSSPAIGLVEGRAVLLVGSVDRNLYALDAANGEKLWRFTTGNSITGAPVLWNSKEGPVVFVASSDRLLYSLDAASGARRWSVALEDYQPTQGGARLSAPCVGSVGGRPAVFVGMWVFDKSLAHQKQAGSLVAIDARTGETFWRTPFLDNRVGDPLYAEIDGRGLVYVTSEDGNVRALDADRGTVLWEFRETQPIAGGVSLRRSPAGALVYYGSHFGSVRALTAATGHEVWSFKTGNWVTGAPMIIGESGDETIVFGSYDHKVYGLDAQNGEKRWSYATSGPVFSSPAAVSAPDGSQVVFASFDHRLSSLAGKDGRLLWSVFTGAPVWQAVALGDTSWSSPAAAEINGRWMIYYGSYNGVFYGLPLNQVQLVGPSEPWSNFRFLLTMGIVSLLVGSLAVYVSRRKTMVQ